VLAVTDAAVLTQFADQVLVVLEAGRVPAKAAQRTRDTLASVGAPIAGFVVSDKRSHVSSYGYGYGYGYGDTPEDGVKRKAWWRFWGA
jgi:Mrp family chromosome partitioning ATPase